MASEQSDVRIDRADNSAFAFGENARAETRNAAPAGRGEAGEELLRAVRQLRADLTLLRASEQTARLDEALADTEGDITRTGAAGEGRPARLRTVLADAQNIVSLVASAGAVAGLLGM
ncbi:hypothetical protein ABZ354_14685 [Streptomyces sp. NPDC005925]|uniref:hypothetical protein n=1 Tax=Streptomyces sp. NPDC005925 TaxID=3157172 RepID=UPI0033D83811